MPKRAQELTALEVGRIKKPGMHAVGGVPGLHLQVTDTGAGSWLLRVLVGGKRREIGLGGYPAVTLAQAREKARATRDDIVKGVDPVAQRKAARSALMAQHEARSTFDECARRFIESKAAEWKNPKHRAQWAATLETYASPTIGKLNVQDVTLAHVVKILEADNLWTTKTETASRLRGRIEAVLDWATVRGYRTGDNPARWKGHLDKLLPAPSKTKVIEHHAALPYAQINDFITELRQRAGMAARALEFAILTAARSGEVRGACWDEIDLDAALWTIPAERMKAGKEHVIPLAQQAVAVLKSLPRIEGNPLVFPAPRGGVLSDMTLGAVLKRMGRGDLTAHGFRSTFRDWAGETTAYPREVIEHALAHQLKDKAEAAYARGSLLLKRRRLMADWAAFCEAKQAGAGEVVAIRGAA